VKVLSLKSRTVAPSTLMTMWLPTALMEIACGVPMMLKPGGIATLWKAPDSTPLFTLRTVNLFPAPGSNWKQWPVMLGLPSERK
jgi:hypothetical protein